MSLNLVLYQLTDRVPDPGMDEECQEEDDEDEDCDELPVVDPLDMHDAGCSGHHILTAPNAPVCSSADQCSV